VSVPDSYNDDPEKRWPVIFDFHGNKGTPYQQYDNSQYYRFTQGQQYLVVYPAGQNNAWAGANYSTTTVAEDLQFTTDLLQRMREQYCIDDDRVYASGKSLGGGFVDILACSDNGDEFAAFAMAAAALYSDLTPDRCAKRRAILESHGDEDATIDYNGRDGQGGPLPRISDWVSWWGRRTCGGQAELGDCGKSSGYDTTCYSCGAYRDVVTHYQVFELGHCWPCSTRDNWDVTGYKDQSKRKCLDTALSYTPVVLDFFEKWSLTNAPSN
jgi:poly(3-hydroxybutyrate) depolymerase